NDQRTDPATGERRRFSSAILPPWARKTPKVTEVLPLLYLHGLSSGDFVPALGQFLGSSAGLSAAVITRLTEAWQAEQKTLAARDGALGFWNALREVFPQAREGRCWFHKTANVLAALPKSAHPGAKKALAEIWGAEDKQHALAAVKAFEAAYGAKFPKAVAKITDDVEELLAFFDYPAEH